MVPSQRKTRRQRPIPPIAEISCLVFMQAQEPGLQDLRKSVRRLSPRSKVIVLKAALAGLRSDPVRAARILVAFYPLSKGAIAQELAASTQRVTGGSQVADEVAFALVCQLSRGDEYRWLARYSKSIDVHVYKYLLACPSSHTQGAWMAADYFGQHRPASIGVKRLWQAATRAKRRGRMASIGAIWSIALEGTVSANTEVVTRLKRLCIRESDSQVRTYVQRLLAHRR